MLIDIKKTKEQIDNLAKIDLSKIIKGGKHIKKQLQNNSTMHIEILQSVLPQLEIVNKAAICMFYNSTNLDSLNSQEKDPCHDLLIQVATLHYDTNLLIKNRSITPEQKVREEALRKHP